MHMGVNAWQLATALSHIHDSREQFCPLATCSQGNLQTNGNTSGKGGASECGIMNSSGTALRRFEGRVVLQICCNRDLDDKVIRQAGHVDQQLLASIVLAAEVQTALHSMAKPAAF